MKDVKDGWEKPAMPKPRLIREGLSKRYALPVFASNALSSISYAPDQILLTLGLGGIVASRVSLWVGVAVFVVMAVVIISYREVVRAYPRGGGDYEVARQNLGSNAALVTVSALLVDYSLTIAVSTSVCASYVGALFPTLNVHQVLVSLTVIAVLTLLNLSGLRESAQLFAIPAYLFMGVIALLAMFGFVQEALGTLGSADTAAMQLLPAERYEAGLTGLGGFLLFLRAFSGGCVALSGVEGISNGVPAFMKPRPKNARITLALFAVISATMMLSVLHLAKVTGVKVPALNYQILSGDGPLAAYEVPPVIAQLAHTVFAPYPFMAYLVTAVTALILVFAAHSAFNWFSQLTQVLSRDRLLPPQIFRRSDRRSLSPVICVPALVAAVLITVTGAESPRLIQMYIVGVFISLTLSQLGMLRYWNTKLRMHTFKTNRKILRRRWMVNAIGFICTATVLVVVTVSRITQGAGVALVMMAVMFGLLRAIGEYYKGTAAQTLVSDFATERALPSRVQSIVLVSNLDKPTMRAISYARVCHPSSLSLVHVEIEPDDFECLKESWLNSGVEVPLTVLASPFRDITGPLIQHVRSVRHRSPRDLVVIYIPCYLGKYPWQKFLHNRSVYRIRRQLRDLPGVLVVLVPWNFSYSPGRAERRAGIEPLRPPEEYRKSDPVFRGGSKDITRGAFMGEDDRLPWFDNVHGGWGIDPPSLGDKTESDEDIQPDFSSDF